jgi:hypothetical protein
MLFRIIITMYFENYKEQVHPTREIQIVLRGKVGGALGIIVF